MSFNRLAKASPWQRFVCFFYSFIYFSLSRIDGRTFAERAVWSAEVHQAGNFGRVAQVRHHRHLSVMDRLICRGGRGSKQYTVSLGRIVSHAFNEKSKNTLESHKRSLCVKNGMEGRDGLNSTRPFQWTESVSQHSNEENVWIY